MNTTQYLPTIGRGAASSRALRVVEAQTWLLATIATPMTGGVRPDASGVKTHFGGSQDGRYVRSWGPPV